MVLRGRSSERGLFPAAEHLSPSPSPRFPLRFVARSLSADAGSARSSRQAVRPAVAAGSPKAGHLLDSHDGRRAPGSAPPPERPRFSSRPSPDVFPCSRQRWRGVVCPRLSGQNTGVELLLSPKISSARRRVVPATVASTGVLRRGRAPFGAPGAENALRAPEFSVADCVSPIARPAFSLKSRPVPSPYFRNRNFGHVFFVFSAKFADRERFIYLLIRPP